MTVHKQTSRLSFDSHSKFCCWFRIPLNKVEELVEQFIVEGWISESHHCHSLSKLKIKTKLMIMGTLAILGGTINSFQQLLMVTNICTTDHNKFFLTFIECMTKISNEFIHLSCDMLKVAEILKRYKEVGLPG